MIKECDFNELVSKLHIFLNADAYKSYKSWRCSWNYSVLHYAFSYGNKAAFGVLIFFLKIWSVNLIKCCNTTQKVSMVRQSWEAFPRRKKQSIRKSFSALILDRVAKTTPIHLHYYLRDSLACRNLPVLPSSRRLIGIN